MTIPPLHEEDVAAVFASVADTESVLVGGQAVTWWVVHYLRDGRLPELASDEAVYVSRDVDFLGSVEDARLCAERLGGTLRVGRTFEELPINAAVVEWTDTRRFGRKVDFLVNVHGLDSSRVQRSAVPFVLPAGERLYVLHPVELLRSRVANVATLPGYRGEVHVAQARMSVLTAREWLRDRSAEDDARPALKEIEAVFRIARSREGKGVFREADIEPFDAIERFSGLPPTFGHKRYPQMEAEIRTLRSRGRAD